MKILKDYSIKIIVNTSSQSVFNALNEGMNSWWGEISNANFNQDGQFTITFENGYWWTFKIIEYSPNSELIWKCIDGEPEFNKEWIGHVLHWKIFEQDTKTIIDFQQIGLTPKLECYDICSSTWNMFLTEKLRENLNQQKEPS
ncbi:hypothetical protein N1F78_08060 [Seonamhaeicola sp. MEBiC1930]|uniref:hypothetical protein n=1 Tax=Seonamhaeicola sp. MEBiC01930 TaxID=2976768 RepID=UPI00324F8987